MEWRDLPALRGRLHQDYPDDLQVVVHDGGPRMTECLPEVVWVRITGVSGSVFAGRVLNSPDQLRTISQGSAVLFVVPESGPHPVMVTRRYVEDRVNWRIRPCDTCGMSEALDAPSDLCKVVFPDLPSGALVDSFTGFCGLCGGVQVFTKLPVSADGPGTR